MKKALPLVLALASCSGAGDDPALPDWSREQIASLRLWIKAAPGDALPLLDTGALDRAGKKWFNDGEQRAAATALAERLATAHLRGCAAPAERAGWFIEDAADSADLRGRLRQALGSSQSLDGFFTALRPANPAYAALRAAYQTETDPQHRTVIARNMERWRWMPQHLGKDHVLANVPSFEVGLWRDGELSQTWPVVVGRTTTPTPSLNASIEAVTFNPWWYVPRSIVEAQKRFSPRHGYVTSPDGMVKQKPGPANSLGEMKIEMPNPHAIYLHDTPSKGLFSASYRAYSHGCLRVKDAVGFAAAILEGHKTRDEIDTLLGYTTVPVSASEAPLLRPGDPLSPVAEKKVRLGEIRSRTVKLPQQIPAYIAYFTASPQPDGTLRFDKDLYGRDPAIIDPSNPHRACAQPPAGPGKIAGPEAAKAQPSERSGDTDIGP
jgi:murein L,D-transpeptidase YcbB/YkuD